jgi:hypothetical protein
MNRSFVWLGVYSGYSALNISVWQEIECDAEERGAAKKLSAEKCRMCRGTTPCSNLLRL